MGPDGLFFVILCVGVAGGYVSTAIGKRIGDEMAAWVIANDEDDGPAPTFGADVGERHRAWLGRYRWYVQQYRQLKQAKSEPATLANRFVALEIAQGLGALLMLLAAVGAVLFTDAQQ